MRGRISALVLALAAMGAAQSAETTAVVGARIEIGDGKVLPKGTILIRDGKIAAVGETVAVPKHAKLIDGTGLTVFPGFIDAATSNYLTLPDPVPNQDAAPDLSSDAPPFMRLANRQGVRPELDAGLYFAPTAANLLSERKAGFTNLVLLPSGGMVNGQASLVSLEGLPRRDSVIRSGIGIGLGFGRGTSASGGAGGPGSGGGGGYPGSLMGIQAHLRQALLDVGWFASLEDSDRPDDPSLKAMLPLAHHRVPAMFEADSENEVYRALRFQKEFGFPMVLVGGREAFRHVDAIKKANVSVVASVDFGTEPRYLPGDATPEPVRAERREKFQARVGNLAVLEKNRIPFALSSRGTRDRAEFFRNLRRAVSAGLSREKALRALTVDAATFAGVADKLGTIEVGKLANLTIMQGDFLAETNAVRHMLIRGVAFKPDRDRLPSNQQRVRDEHEFHDDGCGCDAPQFQQHIGGGN